MSGYMLLSNGPCKVPLISTKDGFSITVGRKKYSFTASIERLWIYWLYQSNSKSSLSEHLRYYVGSDITSMQIDSVIKQFKEQRKPEPVEYYFLKDVPMYADPEAGLDLPIPSTWCTISADDEMTLMQMIREEPYSTVRPKIRSWFIYYCLDYGLDYTKFCSDPYSELTDSFLNQHGIGFLPSSPTSKDGKNKSLKSGLKDFLINIVLIEAWILVSIGLITGGIKMIEGEHLIIGFVIMSLGIFLLGWPLTKIRGI